MDIAVERLLKVKAHILEEPRRLDMRDWVVVVKGEKVFPARSFPDMPDYVPPCGTVACLAGWVTFLFSEDPLKNDPKWMHRFSEVEAETLLNLSPRTTRDLFYPGNWPSDLAYRYENAELDKDRVAMAAVTADRIDRFIAENYTLAEVRE